MQHIEGANYMFAKEGCYRCGGTSDLVDMDTNIEGEGFLALCTTCILDAATLARAGRARMAKANKEAERERIRRESETPEDAKRALAAAQL